ncbi:hypothetical protein [Campylobacter fetus]|nr:hypothetical protein [Campylobacter fetus]
MFSKFELLKIVFFVIFVLFILLIIFNFPLVSDIEKIEDIKIEKVN